MWQYVLYFILGGSLVALVDYLAGRGNPILTTLVANVPVLFILNIFLTYRAGGLNGSLDSLREIDFFTCFLRHKEGAKAQKRLSRRQKCDFHLLLL